jgi:hypothetical protein
MDVKRAIVLGVTGGAVVVWLASAATTTRPAPIASIAAKPRVIEVSGAELAKEIARLHDRLRPDSSPTERRDLFRYSSVRAPASAVTPAVPAATVALSSQASAAASLKLVGMADDVAIIAGAGELLFVREGDLATARYRVTNVSADTVDLVGVDDNAPLHLSFK